MKISNISNLPRKALSLLLSVALVLVSLAGVVSFGDLKVSAATTTGTISGLFHDPAIYFMSNAAPKAGESLTLRLRANKGNLTSAQILYWYSANPNSGATTVNMTKCSTAYDSTGKYEYWEGTFTMPNQAIYYAFKGVNSSYTKYVGSVDPGSNKTVSYNTDSITYSSGWYLDPNYYTPAWSWGSSWYSLMEDAFFNGDPSNDAQAGNNNTPNRAWKLPHLSLNDRYGGDLDGVMTKIAYIKDLGADGVYLHPLQASSQNGGYGAKDYSQVETSFGNGKTYQDLIAALHSNDLRVMQDVVTYFTPAGSIYWGNTAISKGAGYFYSALNSENLYSAYINGTFTATNKNTIKTKYFSGNETDYTTSENYFKMYAYSTNSDHSKEDWGGYVLNLWNPLAQQYVFDPLSMFADPSKGYGIDGYRFDVGGALWGYDTATGTAHTTDDIIRKIREHIREDIPDIDEKIVFLSEWNSNESYFNDAWGARWQNYMLTVTSGYITGEQTSQNMRDVAGSQIFALPRYCALSSHLQIDTHDHPSTYSTPENKNKLRSARLFQMTMVGSPYVFYGEETNFAEGRHVGSFNSFDWDESHWDLDIMDFYKSCFELRKEFSCVKDGAYIELANTSTSYSYARFDADHAVITLMNNTNGSTNVTINPYKAGIVSGTTLTDWFTGKTYSATDSMTISVPAGGTILVTGTKHSANTNAISSSKGTASDKFAIRVGGSDVSSTYYANGSVSIAASSEAVLDNVAFDPNGSFTFTADVTFNSATAGTNNDHVIGLSFGTCTKNSATYKMGSAFRPDLSAGSQLNTVLVKGTGDANSEWLKVWGGGSVTRGASNTAKLKLNYNNGVVTVYNGSTGSPDGINFKTGVSGISNVNYKLSIFNYGLAFTLSNITVTGDVWLQSSAGTNGGTQTVSGTSGSVTGTADQMDFISRAAFSTMAFETSVNNGSNKAVVAVRNSLDDNAMAYTVLLDGSTVKVYARTATGATPTLVTTLTGYSNPSVKIERDGANTFSLSLNGAKIAAATAKIPMGDKVFAGYAALSGSVTFSNSCVTNYDRALVDEFSGTVLGSLLGGTTAGTSLAGGKLTVSGSHELTTRTEEYDWTFKTKMSYNPAAEGDYAGVICRQDEDNFIVAGRTMLNGVKKLMIGKGSDNKFVVAYAIDDPNPSADVTIQLQRVGAIYSFVYSYDNGTTWHGGDEYITLNFSEEHPGLAVSGTASATFDYACFGDALHDGRSTNTPQSPEFEGVSLVANAEFPVNANWTAQGGTWAKADAGYQRTNSTSVGMLYADTKYQSFRAEATFKFTATGSGAYVGFGFGKDAANSKANNGFSLRLTPAGKLSLYYANVEQKSADVAFNSDGKIRLAVEVLGKNVIVYAGESTTPVIALYDTEYSGGYFSVTSNAAAYTVENLSLYCDKATLTDNYYYNVSGGDNSVNFRVGTGTFGITNNGFTNYVLTSRIRLEPTGAAADAVGGIMLGTGLSVSPAMQDAGLFLNLNGNGTLSLKENGTTLASYQMPGNATSAQVMVTKLNKAYRIYVNGGATPVMTYTDTYERGGAYTAYSTGSRTYVSEINIENLQSNDVITENYLYDRWMTDANFQRGVQFSENFSSASAADNFIKTTWTVSSGAYHTDENLGWEGTSFYKGGLYKDFKMNFSMKRIGGTVNGNRLGIVFNKISPDDKVKDSGYTLYMYSNSYILQYATGSNEATVSSGSIASVTDGTKMYYELTCVGNNITLKRSANGTSNWTQLFSVNDTHYRDVEGYVGFYSGWCAGDFDDLTITPYGDRPAPVYDAGTDVDVVPQLTYELNGVNATADFASNKTVSLSAGDLAAFTNIKPNQNNNYVLTQTVTKTGTTSGAYLDTILGKATVGGKDYDLALRLKPNDSLAELLLVGTSNISLSSLAITSKNSYEVAVEYHGERLTVWVDDVPVFGTDVSIKNYKIDAFTPEIAYQASNLGATVSNIHLFGGVQIFGALPDITNIILLGDGATDYANQYARTGSATLTTGKAYIQNVEFLDSLDSTATFAFNHTNYTTNAHKMGFVLGTGTVGGVEKEIRAVIAQRTKTVYLLADDTTLASAALSGLTSAQAVTSTSDASAFINQNELTMTVTYLEGVVTLSVNTFGLGKQLTANLSDYGVTGFNLKPGYLATGITVAVEDLRVAAEIGEYVTLDTATKTSTRGAITLYDLDPANGTAKVHVEAANGYQLVAGGLAYHSDLTGNHVIAQRADDAEANDFILYYDHESVNVSAAFNDMSQVSISEATVGTQVYDAKKVGDYFGGIRFISRVYLPVNGANPQQENLTVKYNGASYTVTDYGALIAPTSVIAKQGFANNDLTLDNVDTIPSVKVSAKDGYLFYVGEDYIDFTVVMLVPNTDKTGTDELNHYAKYNAREYALRSYSVLTPVGGGQPLVIYGDVSTDSMDAVSARMEG